MCRAIVVSVFCLTTLIMVSGVMSAVGYFVHREQISPVYGLAERAIVKGRRELGMPTETAENVKRIETIYLTLLGTTYVMPNNDFRTGGALALWGDDILMMNGGGTIFYLDRERGLVDARVPVPDNGKTGYARLASEKYPNQLTQIDRLRYNDIEFIDSTVFRGLLLSYTFVDVANECYRSRVSLLPIPVEVTSIRALEITRSDWDLLYETSPCLNFNPSRELIVGYMAGGRVAFKAPDLLYLGVGDYHREGIYRTDAGIQSNNSDYGKTIEIKITTGEHRHYSKGHRNLQGVAFDALGRLWTTEHGMRGGDELNLVLDGENYGWPLENLGTLYSGIPAPTVGRIGRHEIYRAPVYAWLPSAAVSSLALIQGFHETWDGDLVIGSLKGQTLFRARIRDERIVFIESIPIGQRIRDLMQVGAHEIALMLDSNELVIFTIEERSDLLKGLVDALIKQGVPPDQANLAYETLVSCNECHSYDESVHGAGPSLYNVVGRSVAGTAFSGYSDALRSKSGVWDRDSLVAYLKSPETVAPGTAMSGLGLGNEGAASAVVAAFEWLKENH